MVVHAYVFDIRFFGDGEAGVARCHFLHACHVTGVSLQLRDDRPEVMSHRQSRVALGQLRRDAPAERNREGNSFTLTVSLSCASDLPLTSDLQPHSLTPLASSFPSGMLSDTPPRFPQLGPTLLSLSRCVAFISSPSNEPSLRVVLAVSLPVAGRRWRQDGRADVQSFWLEEEQKLSSQRTQVRACPQR